jgi:hypothetical protein
MNLSIRPRRTIHRRLRRDDPGARLARSRRPWYDVPAGHQGVGVR